MCLALYEEMLESQEAIVTSVRENIKRKWKPLPLATVALQTLASRKLRMSSETTMKVAEELYNAGMIRYSVFICVCKFGYGWVGGWVGGWGGG